MNPFPETHSRYAGSYRMDGKECLFNLQADSLEEVENRLLNLNPGKTISRIEGKEIVRKDVDKRFPIRRPTVTG